MELTVSKFSSWFNGSSLIVMSWESLIWLIVRIFISGCYMGLLCACIFWLIICGISSLMTLLADTWTPALLTSSLTLLLVLKSAWIPMSSLGAGGWYVAGMKWSTKRLWCEGLIYWGVIDTDYFVGESFFGESFWALGITFGDIFKVSEVSLLKDPVPSNYISSSSLIYSIFCFVLAPPPILTSLSSSSSSFITAICIFLNGLLLILPAVLEAISFYMVSIGLVDSCSLPPSATLDLLNLVFRDLRRSSRLEASKSAEGERPVSFS